jgi:acetoin utilization protein AcuC
MAERGIGAAEGTSVNVPLPPFSGDRPYLRAIEEVIAPAVLEFRPDVIVTQDGADPHHADPLAHLQVTMPAFPRAYRSLHQLAREAAGGRWLALGGGGYTYEVVPRAWTMLLAEMLDVELDDEIPASWWSAAEDLVGGPLPHRLWADLEPEVPAEERARADVEGDRVVDEARALFLG